MKTLICFLSFLLAAPAFSQDTINVHDDAFARQHLVGKWKDQNSTTTFKKNGGYVTRFDNGSVDYGKWSVDKQVLTLRGEVPDEVAMFFMAYKILSFSAEKMEYQLIDPENDNTTWIAYKINRKRK